MTKRSKPYQPTALDTFIQRKFEIDRLLGALLEKSANHFDIDPDEIHWGHVGDLGRVAELLRQAVGVDQPDVKHMSDGTKLYRIAGSTRYVSIPD